MSNLKRYEEELAKRLKSLPSTNKDQVWKKIEYLLDNNDDKGSAILFPDNFKKILLSLFLLLISIGIVWFFYAQRSVSPAIKKGDHTVASTVPTNNHTTRAILTTIADDSVRSGKEKNTTENDRTVVVENKIANKYIKEKKITQKPHLIIITKNKTRSNTVNASTGEDQPAQSIDAETNSMDSNKNIVPDTTLITSRADTPAKKHETIITPVAKIIKPDPSLTSMKKKQPYWAAGIAEQQAANLDCHCLYTSSPYAAKAKGTDYIPSAFVRFYSQKKWFLQAGFKYAAPQYINAFTYKVTVQTEPFHNIVTSYTLIKVYANQLEASVHYFILPKLSVGTGIVYNLFSAADIQKDVHQKQYESAKDSLLGSITIDDKQDADFDGRMKNDLQLLLEIQYKWKQLSAGLNYTNGLNPYINYTDPYTGLAGQNKKNALNIYVRYELWRDK